MWNLDQLKKTLQSNSQVKGWIISRENVHRRERYFLGENSALAIDQDRDVHSQNIYAKIFVKLPGKSGRQGEITKKFFPTINLDEQIRAALEAAVETDHQNWELPTQIPSKLPQLATTDPRIAEDVNRVVEELTDRIRKSVAKKRSTIFNSAELFLSIHDKEVHVSNGLIHRSSQSRIYTESAYSFTEKDAQGKLRSDEYLNTQWAVNLDDLPVEKIFDATSEHAEHSLDTVKPQTGKYPVIVDSEVLATLFNGYVSQLSAANAYNGLPFINQGSEFIPGATGDLMTVTLDPHLEFGANTGAVSDQGVAQTPLKLVDANQVIATSTDKQYADYLGTPSTTVKGNVVLNSGKLAYRELTQHAPLVLEILQFSGLFADPNSGTFSSEIRLARLYDNVKGKVSYIKGGSLSGSIKDNFKGIRLSKELVKRSHFSSELSSGQGYFGPEFALLSDVSIVG